MSANGQDEPQWKKEGIPEEVMKALSRLFRARQKYVFRMLPKDAYMICALIQFADRNPAITEEHHDYLHQFADQLIEAISNQEPVLKHYLELGWNPAEDREIKRKEA